MSPVFLDGKCDKLPKIPKIISYATFMQRSHLRGSFMITTDVDSWVYFHSKLTQRLNIIVENKLLNWNAALNMAKLYDG